MGRDIHDQTLTIRISHKSKTETQDLAKTLGKSVSNIVRQLIEDRLQRRGDHK